MRVAALQFDSVVGDVAGNSAQIVEWACRAYKAGADLAATPELAVCGYPPRDLLLREGFVSACMRATASIGHELAKRGAGNIALVVGSPWQGDGTGRPSNAAVLIRGGVIESIYCKRLLPTYDVFDESRYFDSGSTTVTASVAGQTIALLLCEDLWQGEDVDARHVYGVDPVGEAARAGATLLVVPSASPFFAGKQARRMSVLQARAKTAGLPLLSVNAVGANDDFIFDGGSCLVGARGGIQSARRFVEDLLVCDLEGDCVPPPPQFSTAEELARAIVSAIEGYARKTGHERVLLGLSGGIDSAVVAALAVAALGPDRVRGVSMPGPHSSKGSVDDARESARRLGMCPPDDLPILDGYAVMRKGIAIAARIEGLTDENLQSRLRGLTLMTISNATGALVLSTGNKSELAVGYATLYGDMCGGLAPLGDLLKGQVYEVARWMNADPGALGFSTAPVPESSVAKPPSAELRPDQTDQDSLPPYDELDAIVSGFVDLEQSPTTIARLTGVSPSTVETWTRAIDRAHYKRFQAPVIPKLSARAFGPGRRVPLAMRYRPDAGSTGA